MRPERAEKVFVGAFEAASRALGQETCNQFGY
jgi:hypothetical protein